MGLKIPLHGAKAKYGTYFARETGENVAAYRVTAA